MGRHGDDRHPPAAVVALCGLQPSLPSRSFPAFARPSGSRRRGSARSSRSPLARLRRSRPYGHDPSRCRWPTSDWRGCLPPTGRAVGTGRRGTAAGASKSAGSSFAKGKRTVKRNVLPLPISAFDPDVPAHHLHQGLRAWTVPGRCRRNGEPWRHRTGRRAGRAVPARGRDADAGVPYGEFQVDGGGRQRDTYIHFATLSELDRIAREIEQDSLQPHAVAHDYIGCLVGHAAVESTAPSRWPGLKDAGYLVQHPPQDERGRLELELPRLNLGGVEQVVEKRQKEVCRSLGGLQAVTGRSGRSPSAVPRRSCPGWRSWASQFVAHIGQELALRRRWLLRRRP